MATEKKLTQEDTWKPAELTKHMRETGHGDSQGRRREERERRARDKNKEEERESRRARDPRDERHLERRREGGDEREKERKREGGVEREKERRRERGADTRGPDRDPQRHRDGERERHKDPARERERAGEKDKRREERERDRRRDGGRERQEEHDGEERERRKEREHRKEGDRRQDERHDRERRERHAERRRLEEKEKKENDEEHQRDDRDRRKKTEEGEKGKEEERERRREKEQRRREKEEGGGGRDEERERRHRERRQKQNEDAGGAESRQRREPEETETRHRGDRETGERERRRAGRHPVPREPEPAPDVPPAPSEPKAATEPESTHGEPSYEDDFEEYEEDFEELDESGGEEEEDQKEDQKEVEESPRQELGGERRRKEVEAIQRAMEEENRRAGTAQSSRRRSRTEEEIRPQDSEQIRQGSPHRGSSRGPQRRKFIDFVAAKQREINNKVASKQKKRSVELLRLVELDFSPTISLLDLPPLSQYDVYIKSFGNTNTKQAYVQCGEDDGERDVQTDPIEVLDKWTQHPADHTGACGDPGRSQDATDGNTAQINIDSQRLAAFIRSAAQVMSVLLEEDHAERQSLTTTRTQTAALSFSEGNLQLNTELPFLYGRSCSLLLFSSAQRQTLLSVHGPLDRPGAVRLDSCTLVCVWNIWEPSRPRKILVYESEVRCCCFSPGRSALVLAGTSDGSLVLWDLREPAGSHHSMTLGGTEWTFRQPTFSTDAVLSTQGHHSAVQAIEVLPSSSTTSSSSTAADSQPSLLASEESAGMSFQLASLDERGVLNLWVVLELTSASLAGSQTDLGLSPGGKVKLLHSSCMPAVEREGADIEALQLHFLPSDANHFLISTNMGVVHHGTAHGFRSPPRDYRSQEVGLRPLHVTSVHFSPFNPQLFLVGCADGSMRLHIVSSHWPLAEWTTCRGGGASEAGVVSVRWSQSRPAVFCVLDSASHLHLWDLSRDPLKPVATETLHADRVTAMAVFGSSSSSHQNSYSGVALAHHSGKLQLHYFNPSFSSANHGEEEDILQSMVHQAL